MKCRHCRSAVVSRPRGLCWVCYYRPGVRDHYPTHAKYGRRGLGVCNGPAASPSLATTAAPGSAEKVLVLMERARLHQDLWHPEDATCDDPRLRAG
jgi:hypothetical protein